MSSEHNIHPDYKKLPVLTFKFGTVFTWLINLFMTVQRFFSKRPSDLTIAKHRLNSASGSRCHVTTLAPSGLQAPAPALVYYHGGGFALTYASLHLRNCEHYAKQAGCIVVFVDYRLAPKNPFPDGFNDCYAALKWSVEQATDLGIDIRRIAVGGDSAGGAFAAGVAQKARDEQFVELCAQLLIYPVLDNSCSTISATNFVDVPLWNAASNRHMWDMYLSRYKDEETPAYAAPAHGQVYGLPLSYVETAEFDPLRDEGRNYATALEDQGVEVVLNETKGTVHGYDGATNNAIAQKSMEARSAFLRDAFTPAPAPREWVTQS